MLTKVSDTFSKHNKKNKKSAVEASYFD